MGFKCGIVGLPNVGKSTLFNALVFTARAEAANFPFTTIEPNQGRVAVPDPRLERISAMVRPAGTVPTRLDFVDIAGLVEGASRGEGLGNKFLGHIRDVDAVIHVLRCFEDGQVAHVTGAVDPVHDAGIVDTELMIADLESLERRAETLSRKAGSGDKDGAADVALVERLRDDLAAGRPAGAPGEGEHGAFKALHLLTAKPVLYVCNVDEDAAATGNEPADRVRDMAAGKGAGCVIVSARIEAELAELDDAAIRAQFQEALGLAASGLDRVIAAGYRALDLITFFTYNPKEAHAWTVERGATASEAAGVIHSDFERGFIAAETVSYEDFEALGGESGAREAGKMRAEGRDYVVRDGDIMRFRFNV